MFLFFLHKCFVVFSLSYFVRHVTAFSRWTAYVAAFPSGISAFAQVGVFEYDKKNELLLILMEGFNSRTAKINNNTINRIVADCMKCYSLSAKPPSHVSPWYLLHTISRF